MTKVRALTARLRWSFESEAAMATVFARGLALVSLIA